MPTTFLTADWKNLIMANYIIDPAILQPYLPYKTELDSYQGNIYVSLVGFMFMNTRLLGMKVPFHVNFEEVNLRFYVRYNDNGEWKRGTVFIKEIVPKRAVSFIANTLYHEKYSTTSMSHLFIEREDVLINAYLWKHRRTWNRIGAITEKDPLPMQPGSEEEFIAEHYWGYSKYDDTTTFEYQVQHPPWNVRTVKYHLVDCSFTALYGDAFSMLGKTGPSSVFVAEGSAISVSKKKRL